MRLLLASTALSFGLAGAASAQDLSFGAGISAPLGPFVEGAVAFDGGFALRAVGYVPFDVGVGSFDVGSGYQIDPTVSLGAAALLADYYPFGQGFRLSGGIFVGREEVASGTFVGPQNFNGALQLDDPITPMLGIGYRYDFANGVYLSGDLGAIFTGVTATTNSTNAAVIADLADINASLDDLPVIPYVSIGIGFSF